MKEELREADKLIDEERFDEALPLLRRALADGRGRAAALVLMGYCRHMQRDIHTANYLYRAAIDMEPNNKGYRRYVDDTNKAIADRVAAARENPPTKKLLILAPILLPLGILVAAAGAPGILADFVYMISDVNSASLPTAAFFYAFGILLMLSSVGVCLWWFLAKRRHERGILAAEGPKFEGPGFHSCWRCELRYPNGSIECPYCGAEPEEPQPEPPTVPELPEQDPPSTPRQVTSAEVRAPQWTGRQTSSQAEPPPLPGEMVEPPPLPGEKRD